MNTNKDAASEPQRRQMQLPAPGTLPLAPRATDDRGPIAALLQSIAHEISQSDQRQGNALADLRARLNLLTERQPVADLASAPDSQGERAADGPSTWISGSSAKPAIASADRRAERDALATATPPRTLFRETGEDFQTIRRSGDAAKAAPSQEPIPLPPSSAAPRVDALSQIYASVAQSYADAARKQPVTATKPYAAQRRTAGAPPKPHPEISSHDEDAGDFLDMSALADAYSPRKAIPSPAAKTAAPSPVIEASIAVDKSIGELAQRIAETERKIDQALRQPAESPTLVAVATNVTALRSDLERLVAEHDKVSAAVGEVSASVTALSEATGRIGPMSDTLGHLNEAILSLRQDLPSLADQAAKRASEHVSAIPDNSSGHAELAEKLAIVQNLLLSRAVEERENDTRSLGALESIRGLVQNLHNRIDAMESEEALIDEAPDEQEADTRYEAPSRARPHGASAILQPVASEPDALAHRPKPDVPTQAYPAATQRPVSPAAMSREDLVASARRAAMAASQARKLVEEEQPRTTAAELRSLAPAKRAGGFVDRLGGSRAFVTLAMVALLAAGLGMIYAKVIRKAPPAVKIEQTVLPEMPPDLPDSATMVKPAKPAMTNSAPADASKPVKKPAEKTSEVLHQDVPAEPSEPAANASTLAAPPAKSADISPPGGTMMPSASIGTGDPGAATLPAAIAPLSMRTAAIAGDPAAAYTIADRYLKGTGTERDPAKAVQWFERAAKAGSPPAEFKLGVLNEKGDAGVSADTPSAMDWYRKSAGHGNVQAMHNLAVLYTAQSGAPDYVEAAKWFEQAANFGLKDSQYNLAVLHANGLGIPKDPGASYKWFSIAAMHGDADAGKQRDAMRKLVPAAALTSLDGQIKAWHAKPQDRNANSVEQFGATLGMAAPASSGKAAANSVAGGASQVGQVQQMLSQLGYDPGTLDGTLTAQTHDAIRTFEDRSGLPATGEISDALVQKLKALAG